MAGGSHFFVAVLMPASERAKFEAALPDSNSIIYAADTMDRSDFRDKDQAIAIGTGAAFALHRAVLANRGS